MKKEPIKRYSQALKRQVVREYEAGASVYSLLNKYAIGGHNTVKRWIKQYGCQGYRSEVVMIQTVEDQMAVKAMKQRIAALDFAWQNHLLGNTWLDPFLLRYLQKIGDFFDR